MTTRRTQRPTEILVVGGRKTWGKMYDRRFTREGGSAKADVRGDAQVGENVVASDGVEWAIVAVHPSNDRFDPGQTLILQKP